MAEDKDKKKDRYKGYRDKRGRFTEGHPGKPEGAVSWQTKVIDEIIKPNATNPDFVALMRDDIAKYIQSNPAASFLKFIAPWLPKNVALDLYDGKSGSFAEWMAEQLKKPDMNDDTDDEKRPSS